MEQIFLIIHVISALALIGLILIQQGKGAEAGASFGSGASQTIFGSQGSGSFLTRITAILAFTFFATSLILVILSHHYSKPKNIDEIMNTLPAEKVEQIQKSAQTPESSSTSSRQGSQSASPSAPTLDANQDKNDEIPSIPPRK